MCPKCKNSNSKVIDSRQRGELVWRRRSCLACNYRYSTIEVVEDLQLLKTLRTLQCAVEELRQEVITRYSLTEPRGGGKPQTFKVLRGR